MKVTLENLEIWLFWSKKFHGIQNLLFVECSKVIQLATKNRPQSKLLFGSQYRQYHSIFEVHNASKLSILHLKYLLIKSVFS